MALAFFFFSVSYVAFAVFRFSYTFVICNASDCVPYSLRNAEAMPYPKHIFLIY